MMTQAEQLIFELPHRAALDAEDFLISSSNEAAVQIIDRWPDWPSHALILSGPESCGKSHLAHVWRNRANAEILAARDLTTQRVFDYKICDGLVVEDIDLFEWNEKAAFHLLNMAKENDFHLLFTARSLPGEWPVALPDLRSRLRSIPVVTIESPDEILLRSLLVKLSTDRQLIIPPSVIDYLIPRMERSMAAAKNLIEEIDKAALTSKRKISRQLAKGVLDAVSSKESAEEAE